jgi:hypothetical protein
MMNLSCGTKFRIFEPLEEYRHKCPYILITIKGEHPHPIPLPQKTPPAIRSEIFKLLASLEEDLPDLTPRRFLRHSIVKAYLRQQFPGVPQPTLLDLHVSLANRAHPGSYIEQAKTKHFPEGTGWEGWASQILNDHATDERFTGAVRLKKTQDDSLPIEMHYI